MAFLQLDAIATKLFDLLRQDSRTKDIDWYNGRRSPAQMQQSPAGNVYLGPGTISPYTIPSGDQADARFLVEVYYGSHDGAGDAEKLLRVGLDDVVAVLVDTLTATGRDPWSLGLSYCYLTSVAYDPRIEPEGTPPYAIVRFLVDVKILPVT